MNENEGLKAIPPVSVTTLSLLGCPLSDIVYLLTILYLILQIIWLVHKMLKR